MSDASGNDNQREEQDEDFEALLADHLPTAQPSGTGELLDAVVVAVLNDVVLVTYGSKEECPIPIEEFLDPKGEITVNVGDPVRIVVAGWDEEGAPELSYRKARSAEAIQMLAEAMEHQVPVRGVITRALEKGVIVDVGIPAFMPASQIDLFRVGELSGMVGQEVEAYVLEYDAGQKRAVLSRRKLLQERQSQERQVFMDTSAPGSAVECTVKDVLDFGVFVTMGTIEGFIPRSEMTYDRGVNPADLVKAGDRIQAKVLEADRATGKITLSRKRVNEDPWLTIHEHYPTGATVNGKVAAIQAFGVFVQLQEGITGLIHVSDISWEKERKKPESMFRVGDSVTCQVLDIDDEHKRLALSLKHLARDPWLDIEARYPVGSKHKGVVSSLRDFGAFVRLDEYTEGLLHIGDMSWIKRPANPGEVVKEGEEIKVVILAHDRERRRISLGLKQLTGSPFEEFSKKHPAGTVVSGRISRMASFGAFVELQPGLEGLIHISELDENRVDAPEKVVRMGEEVNIKILDYDREKQRVSLSRKQAFEEQERENIRQYQKTEKQKATGFSLGDALRSAMEKQKDKETPR